MHILNAIIESLDSNYSAYIEGLDGVAATGSTIDEIKAQLCETVDDYVDTCRRLDCDLPGVLKDDYRLEFKMDVKSLLTLYEGIFTKAGLERLTGINQKQLWHYASGTSSPRREQAMKIENAIHRLGNELIAIRL